MEWLGDEMSRKSKWMGAAILLLIAGAAVGIYQYTTPKETVPEYVFSYAENQTEDYPTTLGAMRFAQLV